MAEDGRLSYASELSDKGFADGADKIRRHVHDMTAAVESGGDKMDSVFDKISGKMKQALAVSSLVAFQKKIIDVRGEMEKLQISFETLAGEQVGKQLYEDIKQFATTTPMMMGDLAKGAQTLLGFNMEAEKVMPILRQIGDISMGDAQKFNSLTLAFAQMSSTGKLMGQDLLQMINAGFNPLVVISEKTGKSIAKLKDEMSEGKITVEMVEDAFRTATSEGGKFYGMLEKQSKGMAGAVSNLKGAWEDMLNSIGEQQQGILVEGISIATDLVHNYERVGQALLGLVTAYGAYKAAVIAVTLAETTANGERLLAVKWQKLLNATMLSNPYVAAAAALGVLVGAIIAARDGLNDAERAQRDYNNILEEAKQKQAEYNNETQEAIRLAQDDSAATGDREGALQVLIGRYPQIIQKYIDEKGHLTDILNLKREIAAYDGQMANQDNKIRADMYKEYVRIINKQKRGEALDERERHLYQGAVSTYNKATPWYQPFSQNGAIDYFSSMQKNASRAYGRGATEAKVNSLMEKMGDMKTKELQQLSAVLAKNSSKIKENQAIYVKEVGDYLEASDLRNLSTKVNGILNARTPKKKELTDKEKKAAEREAKKQQREAEKQQREAVKAAEAEEKILELKNQHLQEQERQARELRLSTAQAEIDAMAEGTDKRLAQLDLDRDRELEAIEAYYEDLRQKRIEEAKRLWDADPNNKGRNFFDSEQYKQASSKELSLDEAENKLARINAAWAVWQRGVAGVQADEAKAMNDYLKAYGTYQEKRQAIADDYNTRIQNAKTEGERLAMQKGLENETHALDEQYGLVTQSMADLFADASKKSVSSIQKVIDKYEALVRFMQGQNGTIYGSDGKAVSAGTGSVTREDLKNMGFSDSEIKGVQDGTISIKELTDRLKDLKGELKDRSPYQSFSANMKEIFKQFKNAKNADDFGTAIGNMCGEIQSFLPEIKEFGQDIANIFGVDDSKFTAVVEGLDGLMTAGQGVGQIMSGDIIGGVMSTVKGISQMADALDGAFGADYSSYNRLVEQYDKLIDVWDDLISKKEEYINMSYGAEAAKVGSEAIALVERETEAWRKLGKERLNAGASAGSHAIGRRMADDMTAEDWENIARALGMNVGSAQRTIGTSRMTGLFDLTAEQLRKLKEETPEFWARMDEDVQKYLQSIIDGSEKITELNEQIKEQLTSITFDSMYDSFVDLLSDMDASSKDFAENFEKYMFNAMLSTQIGQKYKQRLQQWYDQMARANDDSVLSEDEIKNLRNEWDAIVADALRERDSIAAATGYNSNSSYSQEGSSGGWQAMGQETADELNGRFTALQISGEKIAEGITSMLSLMASLTATGEEGGRTLSEIRNLMVTNNAHLEDILAVNKNMYRDFTLQLKKIANNS